METLWKRIKPLALAWMAAGTLLAVTVDLTAGAIWLVPHSTPAWLASAAAGALEWWSDQRGAPAAAVAALLITGQVALASGFVLSLRDLYRAPGGTSSDSASSPQRTSI